jgi:hypothetical protein
VIAVPMASKFTEARRRVIVAAVAIGASRNTAARLAGVHPSQVGRWLERAARASEGSRFRTFYEAIVEAERGPRTNLLPVPDVLAADVRDAWAFLDREWSLPAPEDWRPQVWDDLMPARPVPGEPIKLTFHDGTPIGGPDRAG